MRVRVIEAFSGNNSGSYVLVGTFREPSAAERLALELSEVFAAQAKWLAVEHARREGKSPMYGFASGQGFEVDEHVGEDDEWPTYGEAPHVVAAGAQLLVFVDYSVTFPRFLGELVYRRGGRVSVELDHSHEPVIVSHEIWMDEGWNERAEAERRVSAFRADVEAGALTALYADPAAKADRPPPILGGGFWPGAVTLVHAPFHVAEGVRAVEALVVKHGLRARLSLFETPVHGAPDPLRGYRAHESAWGEHLVILWKPGPSLPDVVRVVRGATGITLAEASELVARAPVEVSMHVAEAEAIALRDALNAVGADAEALGPQHFRRRDA